MEKIIIMILALILGSKDLHKVEKKDPRKEIKDSHSITWMTLRMPRNYCKGYWKNECM